MKIKLNELRQIIREEISKIVSEDVSEGGYYIIDDLTYPHFFDPQDKELPDPDGDTYYNLAAADIVKATEGLVGFETHMDKKKLETGKQDHQRAGFGGDYPDASEMVNYLKSEGWKDLFQFYLQKVEKISNAKVLDEPPEESYED
jgi:hypothetical protein